MIDNNNIDENKEPMSIPSILKKSRLKRIKPAFLALLGIGIFALYVSSFSLAGEPKEQLIISRLPAIMADSKKVDHTNRPSLKVMTLNIAHGRKDGTSQLLLNTSTIKSNLNDIARVINRIDPDIIAYQEADGPSFWSGDFNHIKHLAQITQFEYSVMAKHVNGLKLAYGTALSSKLPMRDSVSITFEPSPPTFSKGFIISTISWPDNPDIETDIISLHLDFLRSSVREKQVKELINVLSHRKNALIIMGDFNCDWNEKECTLHVIADALNIRPYQPEATGMHTFSVTNKRIDWILISPELEFLTYKVLPDIISDHQGVVSEIVLMDADMKNA